MKLFGMFFRCRTYVNDNLTTNVQWNVYLIYAVVVVTVLWINAFRMFSVFTKKLIDLAHFIFCVSIIDSYFKESMVSMQ